MIKPSTKNNGILKFHPKWKSIIFPLIYRRNRHLKRTGYATGRAQTARQLHAFLSLAHIRLFWYEFLLIITSCSSLWWSSIGSAFVRLVSETVREQRPVRARPAVPRVHQKILRARQQEARAAELGQSVASHEQRGRRRKQFHSFGRSISAKTKSKSY